MSPDDPRIAEAAARARAALVAGATLDDVLHAFRHTDALGPLQAMVALRAIAAVDLSCAKAIVSCWCDGKSYAHLGLADLELLADAPRTGGVDYFTQRHRDHAIIERRPYILYARDPTTTRSVRIFTSAVPLDAPPDDRRDSISGPTVTFERICDQLRRAAAAWPTELRILRDDADLLLLWFVRVP